MLFHPGPVQPAAAITGILRLEPGAHQPEHDHGFAQVRFIQKGEFSIDGRLCPPGTMPYHLDPQFSRACSSSTGKQAVSKYVASKFMLACLGPWSLNG